MNTYDRSVSNTEFNEAPLPSTQDLVTASQALGMVVTMGVPILEGIRAVIEVTPSVRLRRILSHCHDELRQGTDISRSLLSHAESLGDVGETFIAAVTYGEAVGGLDTMLLKFAEDFSIRPHQVAILRYP